MTKLWKVFLVGSLLIISISVLVLNVAYSLDTVKEFSQGAVNESEQTYSSDDEDSVAPGAPRLTNNPSLDIIATNNRPLLSFFNATGGIGERTYTVQIDKVPTFDSDSLIAYQNIPEENQYVTSKLVEQKDALTDKARYYWRARATDSAGNDGPWAQSRFYLDTESNDSFMSLVRIPVQEVTVSSGSNSKNIVDLDDPGQVTFWQSTPPGEPIQWVKFDLGQEWEVARIWILSNPSGAEGWLKSFVWQSSDNGETWEDIEGTIVENNDTFRNIVDFEPITTHYLKLVIKDWQGYAPQVNVVTLYSPGKPPVPDTPDSDYVLIVGNQQNGFTFTELAKFIEELDLGLETLTIPHYEVSMEMIRNLERKPVAIVLSGNNANYPNLPMFEYNGEYEIIRESDIPLLGICCGHQQLVMAYGYTYARGMGWPDITSLRDRQRRTQITIERDDPILEGIPNPFTGVEIHSWAIAHLPKDFEVLAASTYIQAIKNQTRPIYGEQFHAEIKVPYNQGTPYLINFLKIAKEEAMSRQCLVRTAAMTESAGPKTAILRG